MPVRGRANQPTFGPAMARALLPFRSVNRRGSVDFDPQLQRHHLLPRQLLGERAFRRMFAAIGVQRIGFDDFRANGLLLPATDRATLRMGMPLHRGPHPHYNQVVIERVGSIERQWAKDRPGMQLSARRDALFRLRLLQSGLRQRLLRKRRRMILNRHDPIGSGLDFTTLDAMAEQIWRSS